MKFRLLIAITVALTLTAMGCSRPYWRLWAASPRRVDGFGRVESPNDRSRRVDVPGLSVTLRSELGVTLR
jgi:hypothetical protein